MKHNIYYFTMKIIGERNTTFLSKIKTLVTNKKFWAISSHDAINTNYPGFKEKLKALV